MKADWAFKMFDFDGNGKLDANDIRYVVKALTEDDNVIKEEEDVEGNQKVSTNSQRIQTVKNVSAE